MSSAGLRVPHGELAALVCVRAGIAAGSLSLAGRREEAFAVALASRNVNRARPSRRLDAVGAAAGETGERLADRAVVGCGDPPVEGPVVPFQGDVAAQVQVGEDRGGCDSLGEGRPPPCVAGDERCGAECSGPVVPPLGASTGTTQRPMPGLIRGSV